MDDPRNSKLAKDLQTLLAHVPMPANAARACCDDLRTRLAEVEAERDGLRKAATDLRDDMIMRAEINKRVNGGEVVIEAGNGVWIRFCTALGAKR